MRSKHYLVLATICSLMVWSFLMVYWKETSSVKYFLKIKPTADVEAIQEVHSIDVKSLEEDALCDITLYKENKNMTITPVPDQTVDGEVLSLLKASCSRFEIRYGFTINEDPTLISAEESAYPIAYSIQVHHKAHQLAHLLAAIYAPQNVYCIHVDLKSDDAFNDVVREIAKCFPNIFASSKREDVVYASIGNLQAHINCMEDLLDSPVSWKHLITLCGQDYPLYTNREIVLQLLKLKGKNALGGHTTPTEQITDKTKFVHRIVNVTKEDRIEKQLVKTKEAKSPVPFGLTLYKHMIQSVFSRRFLRWVLRESKEAKVLLEWLKDTRSPVEHYWPTLEQIDEAPDKSPVGQPDLVRFTVWRNSNKPCLGYMRHSNCVFGAGDVATIKNSRKFMVNKFDVTFDSLPMTCLRKWLDERKRRYSRRNPDKVSASL